MKNQWDKLDDLKVVNETALEQTAGPPAHTDPVRRISSYFRDIDRLPASLNTIMARGRTKSRMAEAAMEADLEKLQIACEGDVTVTRVRINNEVKRITDELEQTYLDHVEKLGLHQSRQKAELLQQYNAIFSAEMDKVMKQNIPDLMRSMSMELLTTEYKRRMSELFRVGAGDVL